MSQDKYVHDLQIAAICLSNLPQLNFELSFCAHITPTECKRTLDILQLRNLQCTSLI